MYGKCLLALAIAGCSATAHPLGGENEACRDFDAYANNAWRAANPIPDGKPRWGRRAVARAANRQALKEILTELAKQTDWRTGSPEQQLADLYASCTTHAAGLAPLDPLLKEIDAIDDLAGVQRMIRRLHQLAIPVLFGVVGAMDTRDPARLLVNIVPGVPLNGVVVDPAPTDHFMTFAELETLAPHMGWSAYFDEAHLPRTELNVPDPAYVKELDRRLTDIPAWRAYLRAQLTAALSPWLSEKRDCVEITETLLGEQLGRVYVQKSFPPKAKARIKAMIASMMEILQKDVTELTWMSPEAKATALAKLAAYDAQVGYPDHWKDMSALILHRGAFYDDIVAARRFQVADLRSKMGKATERDDWQLPASSPEAYIDFQLNQIVLPAGFLRAQIDAPDAELYGMLGAGIAHDLTHTIDLSGSEFDERGRPKKWWSDADRAAFTQRSQCVVDQLEAYHQNSKLVLSEAIGNQVGVWIAYRALHPDVRVAQQFFLAYAHVRGDALRATTDMSKDIHPLPRFQVLGPLINLPEFQQAFSCPATPRCAAW